ncbi:hypothetical protein EK21DRAFT_97964 [Setomelanomma holmii]|uniref:Haloacid dehalogenase-like hydrolase n=1 Tax=Setomelanomma holmii TaxID=210430 RepID=A0A9P4HHV3_9PLEO|nr:hypothetical protein EK21DRAFT_97964 [Setomelanomma holmii]
MSTTRQLPPKGPIHWVLDWDGTITEKDTLDALVNIAASTKPNFPTHDRWKQVVDAYLDDYTATLEELAPRGMLPTTIEAEEKLLKDLKVVEQRSLNRVSESKIFEGLTGAQLEFGAKKAIEAGKVALRPGCVEFLQSFACDAASKGDKLHILSVNWSQHFISSCLKTAGVDINTSVILANELDGIATGKPSSGQISPDGETTIIASDDKLRHLEYMRRSSSMPIVYVGDSWTDIECLLAADVGICIQDEPMGTSQKKLAGALGRVMVEYFPLLDSDERRHSRVASARDFMQIQKWASGC